METADNRCARLHYELQEAYDTWQRSSESRDGKASVATLPDVSGCSRSAQPEWFAYLTARQRLILAYAQRRETSDAE